MTAAGTSAASTSTVINDSGLTTAQKNAIKDPLEICIAALSSAVTAADAWLGGPQEDGTGQVEADLRAMQTAIFGATSANLLISASRLTSDERGDARTPCAETIATLAAAIAAAIAWLNGNVPPPPTNLLDQIAANLGYGERAWGDTFAGPDIDTDNWNIGTMQSVSSGGSPWDNPPGGNQLQTWEEDESFITDEGLVLQAEKVSGTWHAGIVNSYSKHPMTGRTLNIGIFKYPDCSNGAWPALPWGLPDSNSTYPPDTEGDLDEIDAQEGGLSADADGINEKLFMHFHATEDSGPDGQTNNIPDITAGFYVYGWEESPSEFIHWLFYTDAETGGVSWDGDGATSPYNHFIILNYQMASAEAASFHTQVDADTPNPGQAICQEWATYAFPS